MRCHARKFASLGYRFWLFRRGSRTAVSGFGSGREIRFRSEGGNVDLSGEVRAILAKTSIDALNKDFNKVVQNGSARSTS
jgi:hypothetical protein